MMSHTVIDRLNALRRCTGKTWAQVAATLDLSVAMLMMVKGGKRNLSDKALYRLELAEREVGIIPPITSEVESTSADAVPERVWSRKIKQSFTGAYPTFSARLHWLRADHLRLSLREFADSVNASKTYISNLEKGKRENPSAIFLEAICAKHQTRLEWLRDGVGPSHQEPAKIIVRRPPLPPPSASNKPAPTKYHFDTLVWLMIARMDNRELADQSSLVLKDGALGPEEKIGLATLYVDELRQRLHAAPNDAEQIKADVGKAGATIRRVGEAKELAEGVAAQVRAATEVQPSHAEDPGATVSTTPAQNPLLAEKDRVWAMIRERMNELPNNPADGVEMTPLEEGKVQVVFPREFYDSHAA